MTDSKELTTNSSKDVNALLHSALEDFDIPPSSSQSEPSETENAVKCEKKDSSKDFEKKFQELFLEDMDDKAFATKMTNLLCDYQSEATVESKTDKDGDMDAVSKAVQSLVGDLEEIKESIPQEALNSNFDLGSLNEDGVFPVMQQMFQMIMSKEVLYPSLLAVKEKYPAWLEENSNKISADENARYKKQYKIICKICELFEKENDSDSEEVKEKRFTELLPLLQDMIELGEPPKDFSESIPNMSMNSSLFNSLSSDVINPNNCNMM